MITRDAPRVLHVIMLWIVPGHLREPIATTPHSATAATAGVAALRHGTCQPAPSSASAQTSRP
jgi:hypothetical protein